MCDIQPRCGSPSTGDGHIPSEHFENALGLWTGRRTSRQSLWTAARERQVVSINDGDDEALTSGD